MNIVAVEDFVSLIFVITALLILFLKGGKRLLQLPFNILLALLVLELFHSLSNVLEWSRITSALDPFEDYATILQPVLWVFFVYSFIETISQRETREKEERYSLAQKGANIGTWDWDILTGNLVWSEQVEPMFGFNKGEFKNTYEAFLNCVHKDDRQAVIDRIGGCINKNEPYAIEHRILWQDGTVKWVQEKGDVFRDKKGQAVRMLGTVYDITDLKNFERELKAAKDQAERLSLAKSRFIANVSHDIRTPLNAVLGFGQMLQTTSLDERQAEYVEMIRKRGRDLLALVEEIIDISKIDSSELPLKRTSFDTKDLLWDMANTAEIELKTKKIKFMVEISNNIPDKLIGDPVRIKQIFWNLLQNAIKYTKEGEILMKAEVIKTENTPPHETVLQARVKDTGIGIPNDKINMIFEPFFSVSEADDRKSKEGAGLGLYIAKTLVKLMGGNIIAYSELGKGSEFVFTLNLEKAK